MSYWQRACVAMAVWQICACGKIVGIEELGAPPMVRVLPTTMHDELDDTIVFDERGVPMHTAGDQKVVLGAPGTGSTVCPVLHKFTHRLDDPSDNPIRWQFEVVDSRGAAIDPDAGMYRLRLRQGASGGAGGDVGPWLTDWLPAQMIGATADGVRYEIVLLRSQIPSLTTVHGDIEIELRGASELGVETVPVRYCWEHVPLAPPLQVRNVVEAVGLESLHESNLDPGNNLGPLLEGVPLEQGRAVMELEIVNGTDEAVYAKLAIEQAQATFTRSWQKTNAFLFAQSVSDCLGKGDCTFNAPSDRQTLVVTGESGVIDGLVSGIVVQDTITGQRISPCDLCDPDTYLLEPRITLGDPRIYRLQLVVTDLRELAPQPSGVNLGSFSDFPIDSEMLPTFITGQALGRWRRCLGTFMPGECVEDDTYQHYAALTQASLSLPGVYLSARTSASPGLPAIMPPAHPGVLGAPVGIDSYQWSTAEEQLPSLFPEP